MFWSLLPVVNGSVFCCSNYRQLHFPMAMTIFDGWMRCLLLVWPPFLVHAVYLHLKVTIIVLIWILNVHLCKYQLPFSTIVLAGRLNGTTFFLSVGFSLFSKSREFFSEKINQEYWVRKVV